MEPGVHVIHCLTKLIPTQGLNVHSKIYKAYLCLLFIATCKNRGGNNCLLDGSYFLQDGPNWSPSDVHLTPPGSSLRFSHTSVAKKHLFKHHFSSGQSPRKIKVSYLGEIKLNSWTIFSHSVILWIKVLEYLACRGWTWKLQMPMGFREKSLCCPHWGEMAINWDQKHTIFKDFISMLLYFLQMMEKQFSSNQPDTPWNF